MNLAPTAPGAGDAERFAAFYALRENPFGPADPRFIYLSAGHRKALAALHYGIERGDGIQLLLAGAGLGKTTLLRHLQVRLQANARVILLAAADCKTSELLAKPAGREQNRQPAFGADAAPAGKHASANSANPATGRLIVLIDDAQDLGDAELAGLFALTTADSAGPGNTHIILAGRPRLTEKLRQSHAANALGEVPIAPMGPAETTEYINHRLRLAGGQPALFTPAAYATIAAQSGGVPGIINTIGTRALIAGAESRLRQIDTAILDRNEADDGQRFVMAPFNPEAPPTWPLPGRYLPAWPWLALALAIVIAAAAGLWVENQAPLHPAAGAGVSQAKLHGTANVPGPVKANFRGSSGPIAKAAPLRPSEGPKANALIPRAAGSPPDAATAPSAMLKHQAVAAIPPASSAELPPAPHSAASPASASGRIATSVTSVPSSPSQSITPASQPSAGMESHSVAVASRPASSNSAPPPDPRRARTYAEVGDDYMRLHKYRQAIDFYQDAAALAPGDEQIKQKLAEARIGALTQ